MYRTKSESGRKSAYKVEAVDTTGAGDAFAGYFIGMTSKGASVEETLDMAQIAAAISVTRKEANGSIPTLDEVIGYEKFWFSQTSKTIETYR